MMLRYTLDEAAQADRLERAVAGLLDAGYRTADIASPGTRTVGTVAMTDALIAALD